MDVNEHERLFNITHWHKLKFIIIIIKYGTVFDNDQLSQEFYCNKSSKNIFYLFCELQINMPPILRLNHVQFKLILFPFN
jgi:hypothetical protein